MKHLLFLSLLFLSMTSCVSKKQFLKLENDLKTQKEMYANLSEMLEKSRKNTSDSERLRAAADAEIKIREAQIAGKDTKMKELESQVNFFKNDHEKLLSQMSSLNESNRSGASNVNRLLDEIDKLNAFIKKYYVSRY